VRGVGSVVAGTVVNGAIAVGQRLLLGPNAEAGFNPVIVTCIQRSSVCRGGLQGHPNSGYMRQSTENKSTRAPGAWLASLGVAVQNPDDY